MRPYATLRVAIIVLFLGWVLVQLGSGVVRLLEPPQRVRSPDTVAIPPHDLNPRPQMGTLPAPTPLTEAQAMETLKQRGYLDVAGLAQQADGGWTASATKSPGDGRITLRIDRDGKVTSP